MKKTYIITERELVTAIFPACPISISIIHLFLGRFDIPDNAVIDHWTIKGDLILILPPATTKQEVG